MGLATIIGGGEKGLYQIRPQYETQRLAFEIQQLQSISDQYVAILAKAIDTKNALVNDVDSAREGLNAIIALWEKTLADKLAVPPAIPPGEETDPDTGDPWVDQDRAQEVPILTLVNAERSAGGVGNLTRNAKLDKAALYHAQWLAINNKTGHAGVNGSSVGDRVTWQDYAWLRVGENLAYGQDTPAGAVAGWMNSPGHRANILRPEYTETGIAYVYSTKGSYYHYWCQVFALPDNNPPPVFTETEPDIDPAKESAEITAGAVDRIEPPRTESLAPKDLAKAAQQYQRAALRYNAAVQAIDKIKAEQLVRAKAIITLQTRLDALVNSDPIEVWCADYSTELVAGNVVPTFEIPGYWQDGTPVERDGETVMEYPMNIAPYGRTPPEWSDQHIGILTPAEIITPGMAYWNLAMEPGHLKWRPLWRYGTITSITLGVADLDSGTTIDICNVTLDPAKSRIESGANPQTALNLNEQETLTGVPIRYLDCDGAAFTVEDAVLVLFEGQDRTKPKVVGFRREPKPCLTPWVRWNADLAQYISRFDQDLTQRLGSVDLGNQYEPESQPGARFNTAPSFAISGDHRVWIRWNYHDIEPDPPTFPPSIYIRVATSNLMIDGVSVLTYTHDDINQQGDTMVGVSANLDGVYVLVQVRNSSGQTVGGRVDVCDWTGTKQREIDVEFYPDESWIDALDDRVWVGGQYWPDHTIRCYRLDTGALIQTITRTDSYWPGGIASASASGTAIAISSGDEGWSAQNGNVVVMHPDGSLAATFLPHQKPRPGLLVTAKKAYLLSGNSPALSGQGVEIWDRDGDVYTYQGTASLSSMFTGVTVTQILGLEADRDRISASDPAPPFV